MDLSKFLSMSASFFSREYPSFKITPYFIILTKGNNYYDETIEEESLWVQLKESKSFYRITKRQLFPTTKNWRNDSWINWDKIISNKKETWRPISEKEVFAICLMGPEISPIIKALRTGQGLPW